MHQVPVVDPGPVRGYSGAALSFGYPNPKPCRQVYALEYCMTKPFSFGIRAPGCRAGGTSPGLVDLIARNRGTEDVQAETEQLFVVRTLAARFEMERLAYCSVKVSNL